LSASGRGDQLLGEEKGNKRGRSSFKVRTLGIRRRSNEHKRGASPFSLCCIEGAFQSKRRQHQRDVSSRIGAAIMENPVVPESTLTALGHEIKTAVAEYRQLYSVDVEDPDYGSAFTNYLLFVQNQSAHKILGIELDHNARFYNAYYWFQSFVKLHTLKHGHDAGLEQQAFKMLEEADFDLDLEIIDMIDTLVSCSDGNGASER
jgi:hypothetical protein